MANYGVDPRPHVPAGFCILDCTGPYDRPRAFLGEFTNKSHDNVAIATFFPRVDKRDFLILAQEMRSECHRSYGVINIEIPPSAIGDVFVVFHSRLERQCFLNGPTMQVGPYQVLFEHHDEV